MTSQRGTHASCVVDDMMDPFDGEIQRPSHFVKDSRVFIKEGDDYDSSKERIPP